MTDDNLTTETSKLLHVLELTTDALEVAVRHSLLPGFDGPELDQIIAEHVVLKEARYAIAKAKGLEPGAAA